MKSEVEKMNNEELLTLMEKLSQTNSIWSLL